MSGNESKEKLVYYESIRGRLQEMLKGLGDNPVVNLEIGSGGSPTFDLITQMRELADNELYLSVDSDEEIGRLENGLEGFNDNFITIHADAREMPFVEDNSVDEITMTNVVGLSKMRQRDSLTKLFKELCRVSKNDGRIVITEVLSPDRFSLEFYFEGELKTGTTVSGAGWDLVIEKMDEEPEAIKEYYPAFSDDYVVRKPFQLVLKCVKK